MKPEEVEGGGTSSTGRKSLKNSPVDSGPMKACHISVSKAR